MISNVLQVLLGGSCLRNSQRLCVSNHVRRCHNNGCDGFGDCNSVVAIPNNLGAIGANSGGDGRLSDDDGTCRITKLVRYVGNGGPGGNGSLARIDEGERDGLSVLVVITDRDSYIELRFGSDVDRVSASL